MYRKALSFVYIALIIIIVLVVAIFSIYISQLLMATTTTALSVLRETKTVTKTQIITEEQTYTITQVITKTFVRTARYPIEVVDALGRTVVIEHPPKRVVSLSPAITEILFELGLENRIVGVDSYSNYPPKLLELKKAGKVIGYRQLLESRHRENIGSKTRSSYS